MREQEVRELYEAYRQVHQPQEEVEELDENIQDAAKGALEAGAKFMQTNPVGKAIGAVLSPVGPGRKTPTKGSGGYRPVVKSVANEETDLFDTILEHLVAEGYADTNEAALAIMANMSEEWRQSILSEDPVQDYRDMKRSKENAAGMRGQELTHSAKPAGSASQKPGSRSREFTNPPS